MSVKSNAQEFMQREQIDGWLLYEYHDINPSFWRVVPRIAMVTRPAFYFIPTQGQPRLLVHHVDAGRFRGRGVPLTVYYSRHEVPRALKAILKGAKSVAMEYSPRWELPRVSRVDGGTLEMVRSLGVEVVSSADLLQFSTLRWSMAQLRLHRSAARKLSAIVLEAFDYIFQRLGKGPTEYEVRYLIRRRFQEEGLVAPDGPIVAANEHGRDPHYEPQKDSASVIRHGDWLLIDMWARESVPESPFADITWVGYAGKNVTDKHQRVFDAVVGARDAALKFLEECFQRGYTPQGWEVDRIARDFIKKKGYGRYFTHRLGHSLGEEVHGDAVNLDDWETHDTRQIIPGIGFTIEPGIYLPEFGMRSEIDVFMSAKGPVVTTAVQRKVVQL